MPWKAPSVLCWLATAQVAGCLRAPLRLHGTVVLHAPHRASHASRMVADDDDTAAAADIATDAETRRRGIGVWQKLRERRATSEDSADDDEPLLEGIAKDIDTAIERRRRRLNTRLASSLKTFRKEVLDEVSAQSNEQKARQERLKERQSAFTAALDGLREDLLDDIEEGLVGVQASGQKLESALVSMRETWEKEVADLIRDAEEEVELAVADVKKEIATQRDDWRQAIAKFETQWNEQGFFTREFRKGLAPQRNSTGNTADFLSGDFRVRVKDLQATLDETAAEVEYDLKVFKRRWKDTTEKLPSELPRLTSLAEVRAYVADSIFADQTEPETAKGGRSRGSLRLRRALKQKRGAASSDGSDPLGLREEETSFPFRSTAASNLRRKGRYINIVTTAALPWMTGTSVNPLLRAAYLAKVGYNVTLMMPWIPPEQQATLFPKDLIFERPALQEQYVRWWCENRASVEADNLRLRWYPGRYAPNLMSIIQDCDDIITCIPKAERDAVILEEPEHLNWYHHGERWTNEFNHVVGIAHTNYLQYARYNTVGVVKSGEMKEAFTKVMNDLVCSAHTDVVVKLSATLPDVSGENIECNVHGVRAEFLAIGSAAAQRVEPSSGAYFLGKALYTKGYRELLSAMSTYRDLHGGSGEVDIPHVDTYGSGPDFNEIVDEIDDSQLPITPHTGIDHAHPTMHRYRVFVNPSTSDVLCTATAEALAMGKVVIIPDHPSNIFFKQFSNTVMYNDPIELVPLLREHLAKEPASMSPREAYMLSWDAASERLLDAAALPEGSKRTRESPASTLAYYTHWGMGVQPVFDMFRTVTGAPPVVPWSERLRPGRRKEEEEEEEEDGARRA